MPTQLERETRAANALINARKAETEDSASYWLSMAMRNGTSPEEAGEVIATWVRLRTVDDDAPEPATT